MLFESASGYALFEGLDMDEIGQTQEAVMETVSYVPLHATPASVFSFRCHAATSARFLARHVSFRGGAFSSLRLFRMGNRGTGGGAFFFFFSFFHPPGSTPYSLTTDPSFNLRDRSVFVRDNRNMQRFGKVVKLKGFKPFTSAGNALGEINAISESVCTEDLKNFLEMNLPKVKDAKKAGASQQ